jgi:uncharacterized protein
MAGRQVSTSPARPVAASAAAQARRGRGGRIARQRTCVACRVSADKRSLHRIVRAPDGTVRYDPTGTAPGRGAYLCGRPDCAQVAVKRRGLQRALKAADAEQAAAAVWELLRALQAAGAQAAVDGDRPAGGTGGDRPAGNAGGAGGDRAAGGAATVGAIGGAMPGPSKGPEGGSGLRASEPQEEVRTG